MDKNEVVFNALREHFSVETDEELRDTAENILNALDMYEYYNTKNKKKE